MQKIILAIAGMHLCNTFLIWGLEELKFIFKSHFVNEKLGFNVWNNLIFRVTTLDF